MKAEKVNDEPTCKACKKMEREEEKARTEEAKRVVCSQCGESKSKAGSSTHMLKNASNAPAQCTQCVNDVAAARVDSARKDTKICEACEMVLRKEGFTDRMWASVAAQPCTEKE